MLSEEIDVRRLTLSLENDETQEGLLLFPEKATGKIPLIVFIHGHNVWGGWEMIAPAQRILKKGYAVLLPSQIGFGLSKGKKDYCGPKTIAAIFELISEVIKEYSDKIDEKKIAVWGTSRGAAVASALTVDYPDTFRAGVFLSGPYDMELNATWGEKDPEIIENIIQETGGTQKAYQVRSSINRMENLQCPVLIIHGSEDKTVTVEQAYALDKKLQLLNKPHELVIVEGSGHSVSGPSVSKNYIFPFLEKYLFRN